MSIYYTTRGTELTARSLVDWQNFAPWITSCCVILSSPKLPMKCPFRWFALRDTALDRTLATLAATCGDKNLFVYCQLSNIDQQLNRWVRCHSVERCRTFWKKGCCRAVRPFTIHWPKLAVFIGWHQQDENTPNGKRITRKWPLDLSSTANEVRVFRTVFLFDVFDLIWVETQ